MAAHLESQHFVEDVVEAPLSPKDPHSTSRDGVPPKVQPPHLESRRRWGGREKNQNRGRARPSFVWASSEGCAQGLDRGGLERLEHGVVACDGWLRRGLQGEVADGMDSLTIATLDTVDSIPLGTDLDPMNAYNNAWAAQQVPDAVGKILLTHDLGRRILDGENLGFTYGSQVLRKERHYDVEGVRKAVDYFLRKGLDVTVVGKRASLHRDLAPQVQSGHCHVVLGDSSDDVFILKQAFTQRCPVVSRDNFRAHLSDLRIDPGLRRWYGDAGAQLQVKFAFDPRGEFVPDYDHQVPLLRPRGCGA